MFRVETVRALFTYIIAGMVVVGGFVIIFFTREEAAASEIRLLIAGFIGSALTFAFGAEVQSRTAHQAATATQASANVTADTIRAANGAHETHNG
jgi:hypothetical protein